MRELIEHLDRESCGSKEEQSGIKKETEDIEEVIEKSILAKALLKQPDGTAEPMEETPADEMKEQDVIDEEEDGGEELYECSTCQMQFASIEDHIREFHEGTEVVLQVSLQIISKFMADRLFKFEFKKRFGDLHVYSLTVAACNVLCSSDSWC